MKNAFSRNGFTLIEVMVATAVLLIMVLMVGSLFRSAASSWDSGYARAEGGSIVRAVAGAISRDLSTAVEILEKKKKSIHFICFKPGKTKGSTTERELHEIRYSLEGSVKRNDITLGKETTLYDLESVAPFSATFEFPDVLSPDIPARPYESSRDDEWTVSSVKLRCTLTRTGSFSGLTVLCLGPDGKEGLSEGDKDNDDIVVK